MFVYVMVAKPYMKIGISNKVKERIKGVQTGCPVKISRVVYFEAGSSAERIEKLLHSRYSASNTWGEWFIYSPARLKAIIALFPSYQELDLPFTYKDNNAQLYRYKELILDCYNRHSLGELLALDNEIAHITNKAIKRKLRYILSRYVRKLKKRT